MKNVDICRLCFQKEQNLINVSKENGPELLEMIKLFLCVVIKDEDRLRCICEDCKGKLTAWNMYYSNVQSVQQSLTTVHRSIKKEEEPLKIKDEIVEENKTAELLAIGGEQIHIKQEPGDNTSFTEPIMARTTEEYEDYKIFQQQTNNHQSHDRNLPSSPNIVPIEVEDNSHLKKNSTNNDTTEVIINFANGRQRKPKTSYIPRKDSTKDKMINRYFGFNCSECNLIFFTWIECRTHMAQLHQMHSMQFACCNIELFLRRTSLMGHLWYHLDPAKLKCDQCDKQCLTLEEKSSCEQMHQFELEQSKKIKCAKCEARIDSRLFASHMKHHLPLVDHGKKMLQCDMCQEFFRNKLSILCHMRKTHKILPSCDQCGKNFSSRKSLADHIEKHRLRKKVDCPDCGVQLQQNRLASHKRKVHRQEESTCDICAKVFKNKHRLKIHLKLHKNS